MNNQHKEACRVSNHTDHSHFVISTLTGCAFASLVGISLGITSSSIRLNNCVITAGIKNIRQ